MTRLLPVACLALTGCQNIEFLSSWFEGPSDAVVLQPWEGSPFTEPIGFVANSRSSTIVPLDLKHGTLLSDQKAAPYLPPRIVATGDQRQLGQVAVWGQGDAVTLFAIDFAFGVLVEALYVESVDAGGEPAAPTLTASEPVFIDADESGDATQVEGLTLRHGYTTTEDWTFSFDGEQWWATGSRSGRQVRTLTTGTPWRSDNREIELTLTGSASVGDRVELRVDTRLVEHDLGATPLSLFRLPAQDLLIVGTWNEDTQRGELHLWDMLDADTVGVLELPEGAQPWRFAFDTDGDRLYVADAGLPLVHEVAIDLADFGGSATRSIDLPSPAAAIAWVASEGEPAFGDVPYAHLFVAPSELNRVDVYDLLADEWIDVNPLDGEVAGITLGSPVVGLSASTEPVLLQSLANSGARDDDHVVLTTTFDGAIRLFEGSTGCLAIDALGPRVSTSSNGDDGVEVIDELPSSDPVLYVEPSTLSPIAPQRCGGILRSETWTLTFDEIDGSWRVEGSRTGEQSERAIENQRFVTDNGEMSLLVLSGASPSSDGDRFEFATTDGVLRITEVLRAGSNQPTPIELPGPPVIFNMEAGPTGGGWDADRTQVHALVPVTGTDLVMRMRLQGWQTEVIFE